METPACRCSLKRHRPPPAPSLRGCGFFLLIPRAVFTQATSSHAEARSPRFVVAHEWKVKESVGADVLGGPQPQSNEIALWGGCGRPRFSIVRGRGRRPRRPGLRAAEDVRPYRRHRGSLGQRHRVFHSKSSDALVLRCSEAEVGQDRASGVDRPSTTVVLCSCPPRPGGAIILIVLHGQGWRQHSRQQVGQ